MRYTYWYVKRDTAAEAIAAVSQMHPDSVQQIQRGYLLFAHDIRRRGVSP